MIFGIVSMIKIGVGDGVYFNGMKFSFSSGLHVLM